MRRPPLGNAVGSKGTRISSCSGKGKPAREAGNGSPATPAKAMNPARKSGRLKRMTTSYGGAKAPRRWCRVACHGYAGFATISQNTNITAVNAGTPSQNHSRA